jgi:hypothetical protein
MLDGFRANGSEPVPVARKLFEERKTDYEDKQD